MYIVLILNALNNFSYVFCKRFIKKLLFNNPRSLLKKIILYGRMFHSFLVNNFHELLKNNNSNKNKNNDNFGFRIYGLGKYLVKIMNLFPPFFSCKMSWSYKAKDITSSSKNLTGHNTKNKRR